MPVSDRQPRVPDIEGDPAPFSSLFGNSFDLAAVESAAQLADSSIFITSSGRRFRLQRITEAPSDEQQQEGEERNQLSASWGSPEAARISTPSTGSMPASVSTASVTGQISQHQPQPYPYPHPHPQQQLQPQLFPSPPPSQLQPQLQGQRDLYPPGSSFIQSSSRPLSTSSISSANSPGSAQLPGTPSGAASLRGGGGDGGGGQEGPGRHGGLNSESRRDMDDAASMMGNMSIGGRFGASALYTHSDGGVQAAETLTDSRSAERLENNDCTAGMGFGMPNMNIRGGVGMTSPSRSNPSPWPHPNPSQELRQQHQQHQQYFQQSPHYRQPQPQHPSPYHQHVYAYHRDSFPQASPYSDHSVPVPLDHSSPGHTNPDLATPNFTNPDPFSPPAYGSSQDTPPQHGGFSVGNFSSYSEKPSLVSRSQSLPSLMEYSSPVEIQRMPSVAMPPISPRSTTMSVPGSNSGVAPSDSMGVGAYVIDTQTPVVVRVHSPPSARAALSTQTPDSSSATRDNVLPGEEILYDGFVKSAPALSGPFEEGHLKVFRNNLSHDLRFHCKIGNSSETHWMKGTKAKMVPVYAYDSRSHQLVYIRDNDGDKRYGSISAQTGQLLNGPSAIYQFAYLRDLFNFQSKLTGESVVLDISSVKWIRLARANSRSSEMYSSVRLQIWHEPRSRKTMSSDVSSFVTAGTALSGPLRERTTPNSSRLMVFLGRSEEYITSFITDDIDMEPRGHMAVRLKPRKYSGVHKRNSRPGIRARVEPKTAIDPAGLSIHGEPYNPDVEQTFELYKTFEIEFESSPSQVNFVQAWNEVIEERRKQRARLAKIQEDMRKETFSPKEALSIKT